METEYGKRLRLARKTAGFTQAALSKKTGISQSTISTAEREGGGSSETPVYADACGVNALWLATGKGEMMLATHQSGAIQPTATMSFDDAVRVVAQRLMQVDEATGRRAMGVLADLATDPEDYERLARATQAVIETGKRRAA